MAETKTSPKKIIDVAHPDSVSADPSGVPLIVTNRPILKDPMVVDTASETKAESAPEKPKKKSAAVIKKIELAPLEPTKETKAAAAESASEKPEKTEKVEEVTDDAETKATSTTDVAEAEAETKDEPDEKQEEPATEAPAEEADADVEETEEEEDLLGDKPIDPNAAKAAREAAEKQLALDKLAAEGTYVLPINVVERRHVKHVLIATVLIVLALVSAGAAYVYLALPDVWSDALSVFGL